MNRHWQEFQRTLNGELGDELAQEFVGRLHQRSHGNVNAATRFFYRLGVSWAPLIQAWKAWLEDSANGKTKAIILRDARPLTALHTTQDWKRLYLNRLICGVPDELSGDEQASRHQLLDRYLSQHGCTADFAFVDSGCYGTIVLELHKHGMTFQPLFFFSKNPFIRGFVNECGLSLEEGEILNDSLECGFPHIWARPTELIIEGGEVRVVLRPTDELSVRFGAAAMRGVADTQNTFLVPGKESASKLLHLSDLARCGEFTGVLGSTSPEWSHKDVFLENWPRDLRWT